MKKDEAKICLRLIEWWNKAIRRNIEEIYGYYW